jgi:hypothetical protein
VEALGKSGEGLGYSGERVCQNGGTLRKVGEYLGILVYAMLFVVINAHIYRYEDGKKGYETAGSTNLVRICYNCIINFSEICVLLGIEKDHVHSATVGILVF